MGTWISLFDKAGDVCGATLVDAVDAEWVGQWRWRLGGRGKRYAERGEYNSGHYRHIYLHVVLLASQSDEVDPMNRDSLDNRRSNLRIVTHRANLQNQSGNPKASSRFRGVYLERQTGKWRAAAQLDGVQYRLGRFLSEEEAHRVVSEWRREHMPYSVEPAC